MRAGRRADLAGPFDPAGLLVDLQQQELVVVDVRGEEDAVFPDGRRVVAPLGQREFSNGCAATRSKRWADRFRGSCRRRPVRAIAANCRPAPPMRRRQGRTGRTIVNRVYLPSGAARRSQDRVGTHPRRCGRRVDAGRRGRCNSPRDRRRGAFCSSTRIPNSLALHYTSPSAWRSTTPFPTPARSSDAGRRRCDRLGPGPIRSARGRRRCTR